MGEAAGVIEATSVSIIVVDFDLHDVTTAADAPHRIFNQQNIQGILIKKTIDGDIGDRAHAATREDTELPPSTFRDEKANDTRSDSRRLLPCAAFPVSEIGNMGRSAKGNHAERATPAQVPAIVTHGEGGLRTRIFDA